MEKIRIVLLAVVAAVIGLSAYYIVEGMRKVQVVEDLKKQMEEGVRLNQIHLVETLSKEEKLELNAVSAEVDQEEDKVSLKEISLVYNPKNQEPINLTADRGVMWNKTKDMFVEGNVVVTSEKGFQMSANSLTWSNANRELKTDERVKIKGDRFTITGVGLESKVDEQKVWIKNSVNALFY